MFNLTPDQEERAKRLHKEAVVIDSLGGYTALTDTMIRRFDEMIAADASIEAIMDEGMRLEFQDPPELHEQWQTERATSGVSAISLTMGPFGDELFSYENAVRDLAFWQYKFDVVKELYKVTSGKDIRKTDKTQKLGMILNFQNTTHIGTKLDNLDLFYQLGIRQIQLTYNDLNLVGAGCTERVDCGLSNFGLKVIERMNKLGILVDVSHSGYRTSMDAIEASSVPVAFTHTVCKSVHDHDRGKSDDQLEAIARKNGYVGIVVVPGFITSDPHATLEHFLDHVDHAAKVAGADKVGIGTDYSPSFEPLERKMTRDVLEKLGFSEKHGADFTKRVEGYDGFMDFINLTRGLVSRGYSDEDVKGILGENFLRVFEAAEPGRSVA